MRTVHGAMLLAFACAALASSSPATAGPIEIKGDAKAKANTLVRLSVPAPDKSGVIWDVWPDGKADVEEIPGGRLIFTGPAGEYTVKARVITTKDGGIQIDSGKLIVTIEGVTPTPPVDPPAPQPPTPTDPLYQKLLDAFNQEPAATRSADVRSLAAVYRAVAKAVGDSTIKTAGDLFSVEVGARQSRIGERLPKVRAATGASISEILPDSRVGTVLSAADRATVQVRLNLFADLLEKLP